MRNIHLILTVSLSLKFASCHVVWTEADQLQPVQGLYIKPSADGTTGDLFVAATENTGTKSQWLTDQPISFLPAAPPQPTAALPVTLASTVKASTSQEESESTQKRTSVTPPINYAYALPFPTSGGNGLAPCPYAVAANADGGSTWPEGTPAPQYSTAFQYFYPQMMAAMSRAMNTFAGAQAKDKIQAGAAPLSVPAFWPQTYSYPYQYLMVDPNAWAQSQKEVTTQNQAETNSNESSS